MEPDEDREFLDLLEKEESESDKPLTIHHDLETTPEKLPWGIKMTLIAILLAGVLFTVFTYKILNPPKIAVPEDTSSP